MSDDIQRPPPVRKESLSKRTLAYLKLAADVAQIVMDLRDNPSRMDWLSLGMRSANLGLTWYSERSKHARSKPPWEFFNGEEWELFPREHRKAVIHSAQNLRVAEEYMDTDMKAPYVAFGNIGPEVVGWCVESGTVTEGPWYKVAREVETFEAFGKLIWKQLGSRHLLYAADGLVIDNLKDRGTVPTSQMRWLRDRVQAFLKAGEPRGYLLGGVPGTGKSVAIRWLTKVLGMSSIRVDIGVLAGEADTHGGSVAASLETLLGILKPDVMILDDLDRADVNSQMLAILERARSSCRIVLASANSVSALSGAAIRPGRFDDIVEFNTLDADVAAQILGDHADLVLEVDGLPAAYVAEFAIRCRVLGREQALLDLPNLRLRAEETSLDAD